jgi:hypothetical protein
MRERSSLSSFLLSLVFSRIQQVVPYNVSIVRSPLAKLSQYLGTLALFKCLSPTLPVRKRIPLLVAIAAIVMFLTIKLLIV